MSVQNSIDRLNSIKERIRVNLVAQGLTVPNDAMLADMAEQILSVAGENGRGIVSVERTSGTGAAGTTDTYTITYTDKTTSTFTVRNGANGATYTLTAADKTAIAEEAAGKVNVPVKSVNGKTGVVSLTAADVGAEASGEVNTHNSSSSAHSALFNAKLNKSGGTMEGALVAQTNTNYATRQVRNVIYLAEGATVPTTQNGDLVLFYSE